MTNQATPTLNTQGYYYYRYTSSTDNTLTLSSSPTGTGVKSVIVDGGHIRITQDIIYSGGDKHLILIARKNTAGNGGNIIIDT